MSKSETERANTPDSQTDLTQGDTTVIEENQTKAGAEAKKTRSARPQEKAVKTARPTGKAAKTAKTVTPDDAQISTGENGEDISVKLTDISDIVAKYSAIDSVFAEDDEPTDNDVETMAAPEEPAPEDDQPVYQDEDQDYEVDAADFDIDADDLFEKGEDDGEMDDYASTARHEVMDTPLPDRPRIVFRRPQLKDELFSNWSDETRQSAYDFKTDQLFHRSRLMDDDEESAQPEAPVIERHRKTLSRSIVLSIGLPIAGGAVFALLLFLQKDIKLADYWGSIAATATNPTVTASVDTPTPDFTKHPSLRQQEASGTPVVSSTDSPTVVSPETGIVRATASPAEPKPMAIPQTASETVSSATPAPQIAPNSVYMARLTVTDTEGSSLAPIPLSLAVAPAVPEQRLRIRVSGLPKGARLSSGTDLGNGEWMLRQGELENLFMTLAPGFSGQITLLAEVIDDATHIQAAPSQMVEVKVTPGQMVVQPAAAPPEPAPQSFAETVRAVDQTKTTGPTQITPQTSPFAELRVQAPKPDATSEQRIATLSSPNQADVTAIEETAAETPATALPVEDGLIAKGNEFMDNGDIVAARLFYERALKKGNPHAATAIGKSYDPVVYEQLKVHGVQPNPDLAVEWYQRGVKNGDTTAAAHIQALNVWLKQ